ncbi:transketolase (plasmid) [Azospirillum sp. B510]|uniref:transketolase n=1 Tax=Azospirillum sp. (strain B510) TaxID=137722 RepID=UPI0001C4CF49|nr:transketolase [Azospirillum sp. B510]BAI76806.1 transketolase [Azospirillum sp. B510]
MATDISELRRTAKRLRQKVLEMCYAHGGHISTCYSSVEILVSLYYGGILRIDPQNPAWEERDRFILSKGHGETLMYALLADLGFFPEEWTRTAYRSGSCRLGGHVDHKIPGIEVTAGALGHGLGLGCGMALAARMDGLPNLHVVLMGDAECSEGSVWEAAMFAAQHKLGQLVAIVDRNGIGSLDYTENYIALEPFADKWRSFGWEVVTVDDGHDFDSLMAALPRSRPRASERPLAIIARTTKGKGVSLFENDPIWHVRPVTSDIIEQARAELLEQDA